MLPFPYRPGGPLVKEILRRGRGIRTPSISLKVLTPFPEEGGPRLAVSVSRDEIPSAVDRNRLKRRVRGVIFKRLSSLEPGRAAVIFLRRRLLNFDQARLEREIVDILQEAKIIRPPHEGFV